MLQHLGKIILSLLITNWIYSEAVLLFPQIEPFTERVLTVLRIPTHDEWPGIMESSGAKNLKHEINGYLERSSFRETLSDIGIINKRAAALLQAQEKKESDKPWAAVTAKRPLPYLSDEDFFDSPAQEKILPGGYVRFVL